MDTKICNKCRISKNVSEFHKRGNAYQTWCKPCRKSFDANYWQQTKVDRLAKRKKRLDDLKKWYREIKSGPCVDCGESFHFAAMQFDHLPSFEKIENIGISIRYSKERALRELAKCELVCSNCHAVRTYNRNEDDGWNCWK